MSTLNGMVFLPEDMGEDFPREVRLFFPEGRVVEIVAQVLTWDYRLEPMRREGKGEPFMLAEDSGAVFVLQGLTEGLYLTLSRWEACDEEGWVQTSDDVKYFPKRRI